MSKDMISRTFSKRNKGCQLWKARVHTTLAAMKSRCLITFEVKSVWSLAWLAIILVVYVFFLLFYVPPNALPKLILTRLYQLVHKLPPLTQWNWIWYMWAHSSTTSSASQHFNTDIDGVWPDWSSMYVGTPTRQYLSAVASSLLSGLRGFT